MLKPALNIKQWTKGKISIPGLYANIPMEKYHDKNLCIEPSISSGGLRTIWNRSPAHYWLQSPYNPNRVEDEKDTAALRFGRAIHDKLFLAPEKYDALYIDPPELPGGEPWSLRRPVCRTIKEQYRQKGITILTDDEKERLDSITTALRQNEYVKENALDGRIELSMIWKDLETGIWLKARPDVMPMHDLTFVDLKTCHDVRPRPIFNSLADFGYYQQGALVAEACETIIGRQMQDFYLLFVERAPPHCTALIRAKDHEIERARRENRAALRLFARCYKANHWPGPLDDQIINAERSEWQQKAIDERLKAEGV